MLFLYDSNLRNTSILVTLIEKFLKADRFHGVNCANGAGESSRNDALYWQCCQHILPIYNDHRSLVNKFLKTVDIMCTSNSQFRLAKSSTYTLLTRY